MKKVEELKIIYQGYSHPSTKDEIEFEITGLRLAIACADQRIKLLEQAAKLADMIEKSKTTEIKNA